MCNALGDRGLQKKLHVYVLDAGFGVRFSVRCEAQFLVKANRMSLGAEVNPLQPFSPGVLHKRQEGLRAQTPAAVFTQDRQAADMPVREDASGRDVFHLIKNQDMGSVLILTVKIDRFVYALLAGEDCIAYSPDFRSVKVVEFYNFGSF